MEENRINIGGLDTMVTVVAVAQTIGNEGQKQITTSTFGKVWAHLDPLDDEAVSDDNLEATTSVAVTIYKIKNLTTRWQLIIEGVTYRIRSIDPISRWSPFCTLTASTVER